MAGDGDRVLHRGAHSKLIEGLEDRGNQTGLTGHSESSYSETTLRRGMPRLYVRHYDFGTSSSTRTFQRSSPTVSRAKYFCMTCSRCTTELPSRYSISSCAVSRTCSAEPSGE